MIEIYRWRHLERWDAFTIPHLHISPHQLTARIGDLLQARHERVDRQKWRFEQLQPVSIHFGGDISKRVVAEGREYTLPLFWAKPGDVVLSKIDLKNGAVGILPDGWDNVVVTSHFKIYKPDCARLYAPYFRLLLQTSDFKKWLWANRSGADGRTEVKLDVFENLEIPLPPLLEQISLADTYAQAVSEALVMEREAEALEQQAILAFETALGIAPPPPLPERPVFIARFKDIERWSHEGMLRDSSGQRDRQTTLPTLSLGDKNVGRVTYGIQKCPANRPGTHSRPYLRVANVQRNVLDLREIKSINVPDVEMPRFRLEPGDILLCEGNSADLVGRGAIWRGEIEDCVHQNHVLRIRLNKDRFLPEFVMAVINSNYGQAYFRSKAKRTTNLASINSKEVAELQIPLMSPIEQENLVASLSAQQAAADAKRAEAKTLRASAWAAFESALFDNLPPPA